MLRAEDDVVRARAVARVDPKARLVVADDQVAEVGGVDRRARAAADVDVTARDEQVGPADPVDLTRRLEAEAGQEAFKDAQAVEEAAEVDPVLGRLGGD